MMPYIYYNLIKANRRKIEDVPKELREEVQSLLDKDK